jgi:hypothetical protein
VRLAASAARRCPDSVANQLFSPTMYRHRLN